MDPPNPLTPFGDVQYAAQQLHRPAHFPHAGDLIILGEMKEDGTVITSETQVSTHGGIGGPQTEPFIAWPSQRDLKAERLNDAEDLYAVFMRYHEATL